MMPPRSGIGRSVGVSSSLLTLEDDELIFPRSGIGRSLSLLDDIEPDCISSMMSERLGIGGMISFPRSGIGGIEESSLSSLERLDPDALMDDCEDSWLRADDEEEAPGRSTPYDRKKSPGEMYAWSAFHPTRMPETAMNAMTANVIAVIRPFGVGGVSGESIECV